MPPLTVTAPDTLPFSIEQTVPRSWVHKRSIENVLLTEIRAAGDDRFLCAGRIPTAHGFFNGAGRTPRTDILFYTELGRQASLAITHAFLGATAHDAFIFEGSQAAVTGAALGKVPGTGADLVLVEVSVADTARRKNGALSRAVAEHVMWIGGDVVFRGTGAWNVQPAALYQRLRRGARSAAPDTDGTPGGPGREAAPSLPEHPGNIVIAPVGRQDASGRLTAALVVDERHPYFFDHPCDHVPGMLLLEGCAQAARTVAAGATGLLPKALIVSAYEVSFAQFVECGIPATLSAEVNASDPAAGPGVTTNVRVTIRQRGTIAGTTSMRIEARI